MLVKNILQDLEQIKTDDRWMMESLQAITTLLDALYYNNENSHIEEVTKQVEKKSPLYDDYEKDYCDLTNNCVNAIEELEELENYINNTKQLNRLKLKERLKNIKNYIEV